MPEDKWAERVRKVEDAKNDPLALPVEVPLKDWQKEFQEEFCQHCIHYDVLKKEFKEFKEKEHSNHPEDCRFHWTDPIGQCHNFRWNL